MDGWVGGLVMGWVVNDAELTMTTVTDETHHEVGGMSRQMCQSVWSHINIPHYLLLSSSPPLPIILISNTKHCSVNMLWVRVEWLQ